jgi:outer membrane protein assembly factor BamA
MSFGGSFFKNATSRFYGIGQETDLADQTNYTAREIRANWKFGVYLNEVTQIAVGERYREVRVQRGATDLPFSAQQFPEVVGMQGAAILGHRAVFHYDTRDSLVVPTVGSQVTAYAELNHNLRNGDHPVYSRYGLEVKKLFPSDSKRLILVIRGELHTTFGTEVPFYERSSLGGENNLRGYGVDRFIDNHLAALSIEERIHVMRIRVTNVIADFEVAPFIDAGTVFPSFNSTIIKSLPGSASAGSYGRTS